MKAIDLAKMTYETKENCVRNDFRYFSQKIRYWGVFQSEEVMIYKKIENGHLLVGIRGTDNALSNTLANLACPKLLTMATVVLVVGAVGFYLALSDYFVKFYTLCMWYSIGYMFLIFGGLNEFSRRLGPDKHQFYSRAANHFHANLKRDDLLDKATSVHIVGHSKGGGIGMALYERLHALNDKQVKIEANVYNPAPTFYYKSEFDFTKKSLTVHRSKGDTLRILYFTFFRMDAVPSAFWSVGRRSMIFVFIFLMMVNISISGPNLVSVQRQLMIFTCNFFAILSVVAIVRMAYGSQHTIATFVE